MKYCSILLTTLAVDMKGRGVFARRARVFAPTSTYSDEHGHVPNIRSDIIFNSVYLSAIKQTLYLFMNENVCISWIVVDFGFM